MKTIGWIMVILLGVGLTFWINGQGIYKDIGCMAMGIFAMVLCMEVWKKGEKR